MTATVDDDLIRARRKLDELDRVLRSMRSRVGNTRDIRRACGDVERLRDSLALLAEHDPRTARTARTARTGPPQPRADLETIPELPYDPGLFADADDEGIGGMRPQRP
ncbi:hypothetical protein LO772_21160 [Yinghuangia sp. ASG 101]|uniref:hypothetical protein n=1 Tax=Yinghuangia sp. ASG 101 TaxID=2896848 RepID=UPI001E325B6B|nr:hypothetical protein [Yinghuangia sp. ASG 101]UGQ09445.1 hypothetical protein LO772_21160 [Yinghuangia sp. ASG 101]